MNIVFTEHAKERIKRRKITEDEIINTIKYPEKLDKNKQKYYAQKNIGRGRIEVVYEKDKYIKIITVYWVK
ncbi:hypothetical protein DRN69_01050 [Candidatus Pacearchaeota archaeon]|nr:MAG: hypothetical protein DRN69_01050 [Candidatus Pacearchaeota archaeon]